MGASGVILAVEPKLFREALRAALRRELGDDCVHDAVEPWEIIKAVSKSGGCEQTVIISTSDADRLPALATHLFAEFPELTIVTVCQHLGHVKVLQQTVTETPLPEATVEKILSVVRRRSAEVASGLRPHEPASIEGQSVAADASRARPSGGVMEHTRQTRRSERTG